MKRDCGVAAAVIMALLLPAGCRRQPPAPPEAHVSYVLGPAWHGDGAWFYPQEQLSGSLTGLAVPLSCDPARPILADGHRCDPTIPQAAVQSLQLPVILSVTDLENGNQILVRADGRGPASPGRLIALNQEAMTRLGITRSETTRVRLDIDTALSEAAIDDLTGAPHADISAAPEPAVEERPLDAPPGATTSHTAAAPEPPPADHPTDINAVLRSQSVRRVPTLGTSLWVDLGTFSTSSIALTIAEQEGGVVKTDGAGRNASFAVQSGPFETTRQADAALKHARDGGILGARIVVE